MLKFISLYKKEVLRFLKVYNQTLITPMINSLLFLAIFTLAFGGQLKIANLSYAEFIAPGLITMMMIQNSFANSSSSVTMSKVLGHITDLLIPPLGTLNIVISITLAALTRGIMVGVLGYISIGFFVPLQIHDFGILLIYFILINFALALIGLLCGLYANSFDQMSMVTSYVITPLSFLSGTFYSVHKLPEFWYNVSNANPFFYMIDGMRYAITGYSDNSLFIGVSYLLVFNVFLFIFACIWVKKGWRIKS
jgi:ABC-2 type transport system permease protein